MVTVVSCVMFDAGCLFFSRLDLGTEGGIELQNGRTWTGAMVKVWSSVCLQVGKNCSKVKGIKLELKALHIPQQRLRGVMFNTQPCPTRLTNT